jgi:hypothetical protein
MTMSFERLFTLPSLNDDKAGQLSIRWVPDPKLHRNIRTLLTQSPRPTAEELVKLFLTTLKGDPGEANVQKHLAAFTSRYTLFAVRDVVDNLKTINRLTDDANDFSKDLFQLALEESLQPTKFFKNFDPNLAPDAYWFSSLERYIRSRMEGLLCDKIRTLEGMKTYKRTDIGLTNRSSRKQILKALLLDGYREPQLYQFELLWKCYQELRKNQPDLNDSQTFQANTSGRSSTDSELFQTVAQRYNQLRLQLSVAADRNPTLNAEAAEKQLKEMGRAVRHYLDKSKQSLNTPISSQDQDKDSSETLLDQLEDPLGNSEGNLLSFKEIEPDVQAIKQFMEDMLSCLKPEASRIPLLLHGIALGQTQVGVELGKNQSTVGRNYKKLLVQILEQLAQWAMEHQRLSLDSETLSALRADTINQLDNYYLTLIDTFFQARLKLLSVLEQEILRRHYLSKRDAGYKAQTSDVSDLESENTQLKITQSLLEEVKVAIEQRIQLTLKPQGPAQEKLETLTETWLKTSSSVISI